MTTALFLAISLAAAPMHDPLAPPRPMKWPAQPKEASLPSIVHPIGFSAAGKFAMIIEPPDQACGCPLDHRTVVVVAETHRGYEGPPNVESVQCFGVRRP